MLLHRNHLVFIIIIFFTFNGKSDVGCSVSGPHIRDVNILLPPKLTHPVEYLLQATDGCFKWSWDHHDLLSVVPEYNESNHCSTSARLRSIAPYTGRKETAVYAADVHTGTVVHCKVYIDMFSKIQIFHSSVKLDLDGLTTLRVHAFDRQDNVFSSLVGLRFMWELMPESDESSNHLVHVPLRDSPLSDCSGFFGDMNIQIKLEDNGVFSDLFVVKGIDIGHELVSVQLFEPQFDNMTDKIVLTVAEAMSLDPPSPVLILIGAAVQYSLRVISGNIPRVVPLPSPFHRWSAVNSSVVQVDAMKGLAYALELGETSIIVEDTRVPGHVQMSSLNVVLPDYISLYLLPLSNSGDPLEEVKPTMLNAHWYIVSGRQYIVELKVFSRGPNEGVIYLAKNEDVKLYYDQPYWKNLPISDSIAANYSWQCSRIIEATVQGHGKLSASLTYSTGHSVAKEVLKIVQEVMVCDQVRVAKRNSSKSSILLPWSPDIYQEAELHAVGGCASTPADYRWLSSDNSVLSVSVTGVVQAKRPGKVTVKAVSIFDNLNFDEVTIEVTLPSSMVMLPDFPVETVVGSHLQAAVTMKASNGNFFYQCDAFSSSIKWSTGSELFIIVNSTNRVSPMNELLKGEQSTSTPACAWTYLYAASAGRAVLHATFSNHVNNYLSRQILLKVSAPIASFSPLIVRQAGDGNKFGGYWFDMEEERTPDGMNSLNNLYLASGSHLDVLLIGGPERWSKDIDYIQSVAVLDELCTSPKDGALVQQVQNPEGYRYRILCQTLGNFTLVFKRGNLVGDDHALPVIEEAKLRLECSFPSSIVVVADVSVNKLDIIQHAVQADRDPGRIRSMPITVANGQIIRVSAVGISKSGNAFANSSSIPLIWELKNCQELASLDETYNSRMSISCWERFLRLENASRQCIVHAVVQSHLNYDDPSLFDSSENVLRDAIRIQVVPILQVFPEFSLLFFNPDAKMNLSVVGGSCFLDISVDDSRVVEVMQSVTSLQCSQLTLVPKGVGIAVVKVVDVGLSPPLTAASAVKVAELDWLTIVSGKGISLMEGKLISIDLLAGTDDGNTFEFTQYAFMNIKVHIKDQIVDLVDGDTGSTIGDGYINASKFTIYGRFAGVTTLYVTSRQHSGKEICSQTITIEVYATPIVHPSDIFLVPGASYVLAVKGGPKIGVSVEYSSMNDSAVAVDASVGKCSGIAPGNATIAATFYAIEGAVICQAHGKVRVDIPSEAILNVQSEQLAVGREMPIFPFLTEGDLFSFYELCKNYKWTIENEEVLSFHPSEHMDDNYHKLSCEYEQEINFIKILKGRTGGRSKITLTFSCEFSSPGFLLYLKDYSASVIVRVVPDPPLAQGIPITWIIPPHYTTTELLPSKFRSDNTMNTPSQTGSVVYSVLGCCGQHDNELRNGVISTSENRITTTDSNNLACLLANDLSTGRIEVASCVRVAEVAQIRVLRKPTFHLAAGDELILSVDFYDNLGHPFFEAHDVVVFDIESNFKDILAIDNVNRNNGSVTVKAIRHGRALVAVRLDGNPHKSDYVMISVGAHIYPNNPILLPGSNLSFSVAGLNDKVSGRWLSGDGSVVSVDSLTGEAVAVGKGTASVTFEGSSLKLQTTVKVLNGELIFVDAPIDTLTNTPFSPGDYKFLLKFSSNHGVGSHSNNDLPYECQVEPSYIGYAKPWKDLGTGDSYCLFFPFSPEHLEHTVPKLEDTRQDISILVLAKLREASDVSGSASALFVGGFSILEVDKDYLQLNLTRNSNKSIITVVGNTAISIHWLNKDLFMVRTLFNEGSGIGGRALYEVEVLKQKPFKDTLTFFLPANGQKVEIHVNYEMEEASARGTTIWAGVAGVVLLLLTVVIYICFLEKPRSTRSSFAPQSQNVAAPQTPERTTLSQNEGSPRTPQPFIDYVRRTIDETPYYTRERRRRFDPQNTY